MSAYEETLVKEGPGEENRVGDPYGFAAVAEANKELGVMIERARCSKAILQVLREGSVKIVPSANLWYGGVEWALNRMHDILFKEPGK